MPREKQKQSIKKSNNLGYPSQLLTLLTSSVQSVISYTSSFWSAENDYRQIIEVKPIPLQKTQHSYLPINAKTMHEINYADKGYWAALFCDSVEELKNNIFLLSAAALRQQLVEWQGLIGKLTLSPRMYEQELRDLQQYVQQHPDKAFVKLSVFDEVLNNFHQALKEQAAFTFENFQADVYYRLNTLLQEKVAVNTLLSTIAFYQALVPGEIYEKIKLRVDAFINKYFTTHYHKAGYPIRYLLTEDKIKCLRDDLHKLFVTARTQLSIEEQEVSYNTAALTAKTLLSNSEKKDAALSSIFYQFTQGIKTVGQYIIQHPLQALTIGLAAQASAAAAYSPLSKCTQFDGNLTFGDEFQVNTYTYNNQMYQSLTSLDDGHFVAIWKSSEHIYGNGIYGQRFDENGTKIGNEFRINTYTIDFQISSSNPSAANLRNGHFVVVWMNSQYMDGLGVYGQRFDMTGEKVGGEFQINTYTTSSQGYPSIASVGEKHFVVVWRSYGQDGSGFGIYGQRFDENGIKVGGEFQINTYTTSSQNYPSIASLDNNYFVVVWQSNEQDGSGYGIYGQRFDMNSEKVGGEFQINTYTANDQSSPSIASVGEKHFVVVWDSNEQDGSSYGVYGQRFDMNGLKVGSEFQINSYTANGQALPSIASLDGIYFVVVWQSYGQDDSKTGIYGQRFDVEGIKIGSEFQINTYTKDSQSGPSVANIGNYHFVVIWNSNGQDGSSYGIYGKVITDCTKITQNENQPATSAANNKSILFWSAITTGTAASISALGIFAYKKYQQHRQRALAHSSDSGNSDDLLESAEVSELINITPGGYRGANLAKRLIP